MDPEFKTLTLTPNPRRVFAEVFKAAGPVPGVASGLAAFVIAVVALTSSHPTRPLLLAAGAVIVSVVGYGVVGALIALASRIRLTESRVEYRDMFGRTRSCPQEEITELRLRRMKLMNLDVALVLFIGQRGTCLLAGYGSYWSTEDLLRITGSLGARLDSGWANIPRTAPELAPIEALPFFVRSPQRVQAILGCSLVALIVVSVVLFDRP